MKVLILEDEHIIAQDIREIVDENGYKNVVAHSYEEALICVNEFQPDLILTDINLKGIKTGIDFVRDLKQKNAASEIIFITAHSDVKTLEEAQQSEPINFLVKPFNESQLNVTLKIAENYIAKKHEAVENISILSHKELRVLQLIAKNKTSKEIAEELHVSEKTIRNHRYNITKKLNLSGENNSLLSWAVKNFS